MKASRTFTLLSALLLSMLFTACGDSGTGNGSDNDSTNRRQPEIVKVEPQNFPVNDLPESQFGKVVTEAEDPSLKMPEASTFSQAEGGVPEWLEAIISRESIVLFASKVLTEMPDELEFIQAGQSHLESSVAGWKAFYTAFTTRPSNASMIIYGAYQNEDASYWTSLFSKAPASLELMTLTANEGSVELGGLMQAENDAFVFKTNLEKEKVSITKYKVGNPG